REHAVDPRTFPDVNWKEFLTLAPLAVLTVWIGVYPGYLMRILRPAIEQVLTGFGRIGF
ncbi:MAG: NADH-quinone oxidoreductase subunit M, partial [Chloroflexota bacterium]